MHYSFFFTVEPENDVDNPGDQLRLVATGVVGPVADINRYRFMGDRPTDHPTRGF